MGQVPTKQPLADTANKPPGASCSMSRLAVGDDNSFPPLLHAGGKAAAGGDVAPLDSHEKAAARGNGAEKDPAAEA